MDGACACPCSSDPVPVWPGQYDVIRFACSVVDCKSPVSPRYYLNGTHNAYRALSVFGVHVYALHVLGREDCNCGASDSPYKDFQHSLRLVWSSMRCLSDCKDELLVA